MDVYSAEFMEHKLVGIQAMSLRYSIYCGRDSDVVKKPYLPHIHTSYYKLGIRINASLKSSTVSKLLHPHQKLLRSIDTTLQKAISFWLAR